MPQPRSELTQSGLPLWAAAFVGVACMALIGLSVWHQWIARENDLRSLPKWKWRICTRSLTQHANDTFELADNVVTSVVKRIENRTGSNTIEKIQQFLQLPRTDSRSPGIVVLGRNRALDRHQRTVLGHGGSEQFEPRVFPAPPGLAKPRTPLLANR